MQKVRLPECLCILALIAVVLMACCAGCGPSDFAKKLEEDRNARKANAAQNGTFSVEEFGGHSYIIKREYMRESRKGFGFMGMTHNPDCQCQEGTNE